jgi:cytochrome b561
VKTLQRSAAPVPEARFLPNARHLVLVVVMAAVLALGIVLASTGGDSDPVRVVPSAPLPPSPAERDQPPGQWGPGMRP